MDISDDAKNKGKSNKETSKIDQQLRTSQKRRALVKGSAAVLPAIFTLRSGAVFAFGSSTSRTVAQCIEVAATRAEPDPVTDFEDEWFRRETLYRSLKRDDDGSDFSVYLIPDSDPPTWSDKENNDQWRDIPPVDPLVPLQMQSLGDGSTATVTDFDVPSFVLVLVDANGMETGFAVSSDGTGSPLILSCMASIIAA